VQFAQLTSSGVFPIRNFADRDTLAHSSGLIAAFDAGGVSSVLGEAIKLRIPSFDFEDRLKSLLLRLAKKGKDVILYAERLRSLGMQDVFDRVTRNAR